MKIAYFDMIGGASGDMILGALLDAGLSLTALKRELKKLPLRGWQITTQKVKKHDITATSVSINVTKPQSLRTLQIIEPILKQSSLSKTDIARSIKIFRNLGKVEANVHGTTIENVHFHEIGAIDTIIDIVGVVCGLRLLGIEQIVISSFPIGRAGPATLELLKDLSVYGLGERVETVTPTGAAILTTIASQNALPPCTISTIGYGAGKMDFISRPNLLRLVIGQSPETDKKETLVLLETNIDDVNPQIYDYISEQLFQKKALDVWLTPIQMKKNRPAITLSILCQPDDEIALTQIIFKEGLTLGIRRQLLDRISLIREIKTVKTEFGPIRVKIAKYQGKIVRITPEYEDCKEIAKKQSIPIQKVLTSAV